EWGGMGFGYTIQVASFRFFLLTRRLFCSGGQVTRLRITCVDEFEIAGFFAHQQEILEAHQFIVGKVEVWKFIGKRGLQLTDQKRFIGLAFRDQEGEIVEYDVKTWASHWFYLFFISAPDKKAITVDPPVQVLFEVFQRKKVYSGLSEPKTFLMAYSVISL